MARNFGLAQKRRAVPVINDHAFATWAIMAVTLIIVAAWVF